MNKRDFLRTIGGASLGMTFAERLLAQYADVPHQAVAADEAFWTAMRGKFRLKPDYINLENGFYCLQPEEVLDAFVSRVREINYEASYYMRTRQSDDKLSARKRLAGLAGCAHDEVIITRNTTESLDTVISGFDWKAGDEAVMAEQDYGAMLDQFKLQARRYGMVNRIVSLPNHPKSDEEIVQLYEGAITARTRLLMVPHMVNITGQILPVRQISDMAHRHGVDVMVDGAHAFAHFDFKIPDLGCDFYGTSLHKWLACPLGAGLLYVRREKVASLWPVFGDGSAADDIGKLNHTGTHPVHTDLAIHSAIDFQERIGIQRKEARLRYLQNYWTTQVRQTPNVIVNTPVDPTRSCAIANVGIGTIRPGDLATILLQKYKVWTVAIDGANVHGVRVAPHLFTSTGDLDVLVRALKELAAA